MGFKDFPGQQQGIQLLQRSLERGRLAHAYLFTGPDLADMEAIARALAQTLNCERPQRGSNGAAIDSCGSCAQCRKIEHGNHGDVHWIRPESKSRIISVEQMRDLIQQINLKPTEAAYKVAIIVAADRMNPQAANAFLKTLEEPPGRSILILLTTEPQRLLETILSRCLRLNFGGGGGRPLSEADANWLESFATLAGSEQKSLLSRYRLMDHLLGRLNEIREQIDEQLTARSPLQQFSDVEKQVRDRWEDELKAGIEAEYRRQRADLLQLVQRWLRDVWIQTTAAERELLEFPALKKTEAVARRLSSADALENLEILETTQRLLNTNVQEALALEVGMLKLKL